MWGSPVRASPGSSPFRRTLRRELVPEDRISRPLDAAVRSAVRTAPNGPVVRAEHAFAIAVGSTALSCVIWLDLAAAAELGAIAIHHATVAYPTGADVLSPLLHPSDPAAGLTAA